jgi:hypothetical protein
VFPTATVIPGLDPGTQLPLRRPLDVQLDGRVKPGHDGGGEGVNSGMALGFVGQSQL